MADRCRHWVGIFDSSNVARGAMAERQCAVGVRYMELARATRPTEPEWNRRLPCWGDRDGVHLCEKRSLLTTEERGATRRHLERVMEFLPTVLASVPKKAGYAGILDIRCVICDTIVSYATYAGRGGVGSSGSCATKGCLSWMT